MVVHLRKNLGTWCGTDVWLSNIRVAKPGARWTCAKCLAELSDEIEDLRIEVARFKEARVPRCLPGSTRGAGYRSRTQNDE
jgi:hypothetical protein